MFDSEVGLALQRYADAVDGLAAVSLSSLSRDELLSVVVGWESLRRRQSVIDHAVVGELDRRGVWAEVGDRSTAVLLGRVLRLDPGEARARVTAARDLGPRVGVSGELLGPIFSRVAAAQADGVISAAHAAVIVKAVDDLPADVAATEDTRVEQALVSHAADCTPGQLAVLARRIGDHLDPDGTLTRDADRDRRRGVTLTSRRDGTGHLDGTLTPACLAAWQAITDSLAAPRPGVDGTPDPRSPGQRTHDAFHDAALRLLRSDTLPDCGGIPVTIIATVTADQLASCTAGDLAGGDAAVAGGLARTAHGGLISIPELLGLADETQLVTAVTAPGGGVLAYRRTRRLATPGQRLALIARDRGCSFPGCTIPPTWTQAHHVIAWNHGGPTDLDNLTLLCGHHHRSFDKNGWHCQMLHGVPHWTPPTWLDPHQTPRRNTTHHTDIHFHATEEHERQPTHAA